MRTFTPRSFASRSAAATTSPALARQAHVVERQVERTVAPARKALIRCAIWSASPPGWSGVASITAASGSRPARCAARGGSWEAPRAARGCCSRRAPCRSGCLGGRARPGTGYGRDPGRVRFGRRRMPVPPPARTSHTPEHRGQRPEARRLDVHRPRRPAPVEHVRDRVDRVSQVLRSRTASRIGASVRDVGVLEPGVRERLDHHAVELGIGHHVHGSSLYWPFRSRESTAPVATSCSTSSGVQLFVGSSFSFVPG